MASNKIKSIKKYTKKSGIINYQFQIKTPTKNVVHRRGFQTYEDAAIAYMKIKQDILAGKYQRTNNKITFKQVYEQWLATYKTTVKPSTYYAITRIFSRNIIPYFGNMPISKITPQYCQSFINKLTKKYIEYDHMLIYAKTIFKNAIRLGYIDKSPFIRTITPKTTQLVKNHEHAKSQHKNYYNKEQLSQFLNYVKNNQSIKKYAFFRLLAYSGLRKGEMLALTWQDIDFKKSTIRVNKTVARISASRIEVHAPKTIASNRTIIIDKKTMNVLKAWKLQQSPKFNKNIVFTDVNGNIINLGSPNFWLESIYKKSDLPKITVHGFRHTHATLLYENNPYITPKDVQKRLGHSNVNTTMNIYEHATDNSNNKILKALNNLNEKEG